MNVYSEYITISFTGKGTVVESKVSDKHFDDAVRELKRIQLERKNERTGQKKKKKGVRRFFLCLSGAVLETVRDWKRKRELRRIDVTKIPPIGLLGDGNAS